MSDDDVRQAYWRRMRRLTLAMTLLIALCVVVLPLLMPALNGYRFLRIPLGYFLLGHAAIVVLAILLYGFFTGQERSDRAYNMTIQF
jgi:putative solute:sodium symporter small subunit